MDDLTARAMGMNVNPSTCRELTDCRTCMDYRARPGAPNRCLRLAVNIDPARHRHRAIWCRREDTPRRSWWQRLLALFGLTFLAACGTAPAVGCGGPCETLPPVTTEEAPPSTSQPPPPDSSTPPTSTTLTTPSTATSVVPPSSTSTPTPSTSPNPTTTVQASSTSFVPPSSTGSPSTSPTNPTPATGSPAPSPKPDALPTTR